jgi:hypothetical protein
VVTGATKLTGINGYSFDGVNDRIACANPQISGDAEISMWAWVTPRNATASGMLTIGNTGVSLNACSLFSSISSGRELSVEFAGGNGWRTSAGVYDLNETFLLSMSKTPGPINTTTKLYKNGVELSCTGSSGTPNINTSVNTVVGTFSTGTAFFNGNVNQCGIEPIALSATQHRELFNRGRKYLGNR